jgi:hypothetical protein
VSKPGIYVPGIDRTVSVAAYCAAIRKAKANPDATFPYTLEGWWPGTGADIVRQFRKAAHNRITAGRPITR